MRALMMTKKKGGGWQPGSDTVLYVPMKTDLLDHGPNNISLTNTNVAINNVGGVNAGYFPAVNAYYNLKGDITSYMASSTYFTVSVWVNALQLPTGSNPIPFTSICGALGYNSGYSGFSLKLLTSGWNGEFLQGNNVSTNVRPTLGQWYLITLTRDNSGNKLYVNGQLIGSSTGWVAYYDNFVIGGDRTDDEGLRRHRRGYMSEFILEKKGWTAQEISDYYNQIKGDYGIS